MQPQPEQLIQTFASLIEGDDAVMNRRRKANAEQMPHDRAILPTLLGGFLEARSAWVKKQVASADDFNLLQVMGVANDEVTHSKILAWLLERRLERGSHAQDNLGFRLLIEELGPALGAGASPQIMCYPNEPYWVRREVRGKKSRVDIEIAARGKFIIHIENKIGWVESEGQTHREWQDLERRATKLGIPTSNVHGIFLTLDCSPPACEHFVAVGWHRIATMLDRFVELAQPPEVKLFVAHYAKAVRTLALREPETEQHPNENTSV
jgi:hypothetical protein